VVAAPLWQPRDVPGGFTEVWRHELRSIAELAHLRARLRTELTGSPVVARPEQEHWSERLVLVVDELASNGLRHGGPPVRATLSRSGEDWMITVTDSAASEPPHPAEGRDPARGGLGLYLVADLTQRHGWSTARSAKVVWAVLSATDPTG
jgi:signal transduction histidine kinase